MTGAEPWRTGSAVTDQPVGMRLNQMSTASAGSTGSLGSTEGRADLASSPAQKKAAAKAIEDHIEPDTRKAGDWAQTETNSAVKAFHDGWLTSSALKKAHEAWDEQVKNLMNRLASEKVALRGANNVLHSTDVEAGAGVRSVSVIDGY